MQAGAVAFFEGQMTNKVLSTGMGHKTAKRPLKRFLVFVYEDHYPAGGWGDFVGSFGTLAEAQAVASKCEWKNADIVDSGIGEIVY